MMSTPPADYPITGLCVVADPAKCPPGYDLIYYSEDKKDDCDLWKDSFFKSRVTRYLCVTRVFPLDGGKLNNVLSDIVIQNEKELPPSGYTLIENTVDTGEKASRKKQVCVRMIPRSNASQAITKMIILSRSKRAPAEHTLAGEINGLMLCFKYGNVPESKASPLSSTTNSAGIPNSGLNSSQFNDYFKTGGAPVPAVRESLVGTGSSHPTPARRTSNNLQTYPLSGVPFQVNPRYVTASGATTSLTNTVSYRSHVDIENEFSYPFRLERSTVNKYL